MTDDDYIAALQTILDGNERADEFGSEVWITDLRPVDDADYPELEVSFQLRVPQDQMFRGAPRSGTTRVLFGQEWLRASGYADPAAYAPVVAKEAIWAATALVHQARRGGSAVDDEPVEVIEASLPSRDELWRELEGALGRQAAGLTRTSHGVFEVVDEDGEVFLVHVTPREWLSYVVECERGARVDAGIGKTGRGEGLGVALFCLDEAIGSRRDGEDHIVFFRGAFERSVRAELPPVRSPAPVKPPKKPKGKGKSAKARAKAQTRAAARRLRAPGEAAGTIEPWHD